MGSLLVALCDRMPFWFRARMLRLLAVIPVLLLDLRQPASEFITIGAVFFNTGFLDGSTSNSSSPWELMHVRITLPSVIPANRS